MSEMQGRRKPDLVAGEPGDWPAGNPDGHDWEPGDYAIVEVRGLAERRELYFRDPFGMVGRCVTHTITEEPDGTITVTPSIRDEGVGTWHGWLTKGVWTW